MNNYNHSRMFKKGITILVLLLIGFNSFAGYNKTIDSLMNIVKEASYYDSAKLCRTGQLTIEQAKKLSAEGAIAEVHLYYGNYFFYIRNLERSKKYYQQALEEAKKWKNDHIEGLSQIRLSYFESEKGNFDIAEKELSELLVISKEKQDFENVAEIYNLLGIIYKDGNQPKEAMKSYLNGITISEAHNLNYYSAVFRNNFGLIKLDLGQIKEALDDFHKGLVMSDKENNKRLSTHIKMNICLAYVLDKTPEKAYSLFREVIEYYKKNNFPQELADIYINLASAFSDTDRKEKALDYLDTAISVIQTNNLNRELANAYLGKAGIYIDLKKTAEAEKTLEKVKSIAESTHEWQILSMYHLMKYQIYTQTKNYKEALEEFKLHIKIKDSLDGNLNTKTITELQQNQKVQKKEIELEREKEKSILLEKSNQEERYLKWFSIIAGISVIILIFIISYSVYNKKIKEKQRQFSRQLIQNIEEERQRISRDIHDEIGQSLSVIKAKIINEKNRNSESTDELQNQLGQVIEQTREISRNLYPTYLEKIGLDRSVAALMESIQGATKMECSSEITEEVQLLPIHTQTHLFRIIQECANNTIKHSGATGLKISITENNRDFVLTYQDNGSGLKVKKNHLGIGLLSMQERAKIINGSFDIDEKLEKGFKLILKFRSPKTQII